MNNLSRNNIILIVGGVVLLCALGAITLFLILGARNYFGGGQPTQAGPEAAYTAVAQTVEAQLTQAAIATQLVAPTQTPVTVLPTNTLTPLPTNTPLPPTLTPIPPTATAIPIPCDRATFVEDVTYPDNTEVAAGTTFVKTWRLRNNGSCTWNSSYALVFDRGDAMNGPASAQLTTGTVAPGQLIDVSVTLKAPSSTGTYQGYWKLRNGGGAIFGIGANAQDAFWVKIKVTNPASPTPSANVTFDFLSKGSSAEWHNATSILPWGDPGDDSPGVAASVDSAKLEDNKTYSRILATFPQHIDNGIIYGIYPNYTVQNGDHLRSSLGFRADCSGGKVRFIVKYREGTTETTLGEWVKSCDGGLIGIDKDLSSLNGKILQFILYVSAEGSFDSDKSVWVNPRIER
jgi:hypothetical protein